MSPDQLDNLRLGGRSAKLNLRFSSLIGIGKPFPLQKKEGRKGKEKGKGSGREKRGGERGGKR